MLKVCVVSDTHYNRGQQLPVVLLEKVAEERPDIIIHCGDVIDEDILRALGSIAPVHAVKGNADHLNLPEELVIEISGVRIGVIHSHQLFALSSQALTYRALDMNVDVLLFGHTHRFYVEEVSYHGREVILLNPGSPTRPRLDEPGFVILNLPEKDVRRVCL